jgi:CrcB protein
MDRYLLVALGSAVGGMARFWLTQMGAVWWGAEFPWGTLVINLVGSVLIGMVAGLGGAVSNSLRILLMTGVCGGFTTFSAFSLQNVELIENGQLGSALGYIALSVLFCVVGCWVGYAGATNHL